jgi:hypothetical protein
MRLKGTSVAIALAFIGGVYVGSIGMPPVAQAHASSTQTTAHARTVPNVITPYCKIAGYWNTMYNNETSGFNSASSNSNAWLSQTSGAFQQLYASVRGTIGKDHTADGQQVSRLVTAAGGTC